MLMLFFHFAITKHFYKENNLFAKISISRISDVYVNFSGRLLARTEQTHVKYVYAQTSVEYRHVWTPYCQPTISFT